MSDNRRVLGQEAEKNLMMKDSSGIDNTTRRLLLVIWVRIGQASMIDPPNFVHRQSPSGLENQA